MLLNGEVHLSMIFFSINAVLLYIGHFPSHLLLLLFRDSPKQ